MYGSAEVNFYYITSHVNTEHRMLAAIDSFTPTEDAEPDFKGNAAALAMNGTQQSKHFVIVDILLSYKLYMMH